MAVAVAECWNCRRPATHARTYPTGELLECERCARERAAEDRGGAYALSRVLATVLAELRGSGLTREEITASVGHLLAGGDAAAMAARWEIGFASDERYTPIPDAHAGARAGEAA